jgi:hypothetical protein
MKEPRETIEILTTLEQQMEVYAALKSDKEAVARWEVLMRVLAGLDDNQIKLIKGDEDASL